MQICLLYVCIHCSYYFTDKCSSNIVCQLQDGATALHIACNVEVVTYLLSRSFNIEGRDKVLLLILL